MMRSYISALSLGGALFSGVATAASIGDSVQNAAYSAKQIKITNSGSTNGIYWFDADGAGGISPFMSWADQSSSGGGWTLVHDNLNSKPDMDGFIQNVLGLYGASNYRVISATFDATFGANTTTEILNPFTWNYLSGNQFSAMNIGLFPNEFSLNTLIARNAEFTIYVRENITPPYIAASIPEPETYAMLLAGLGVMGAVARRRKQK